MMFDRRGMCWFWTTDDWAMRYCKFDGEECHASRAISEYWFVVEEVDEHE